MNDLYKFTYLPILTFTILSYKNIIWHNKYVINTSNIGQKVMSSLLSVKYLVFGNSNSFLSIFSYYFMSLYGGSVTN